MWLLRTVTWTLGTQIKGIEIKTITNIDFLVARGSPQSGLTSKLRNSSTTA